MTADRWMDSQDVLHIEVWEKRVIGSEVCIGRVVLNKSALPAGFPSTEGFWSPFLTVPLGSPKDRKTRHMHEGSGKPPLSRDGSASGSIADSLDTSFEHSNRGTITFRVNYESRHQEWMDLAPLRGKFFVWGALQSARADECVLKPQIVEGVDELLGQQGFLDLVMGSGHFGVLVDDSSHIGFGVDYEKVARGEPVTFSPPVRTRGKMEAHQSTVAASCGVGHFLIVLESGQLYSLGFNHRGELGQGTVSDKADFEPKRVLGLNNEKVVGAAAGVFRSLCWTADGKLFSWGDASLVRMWTPETDWIDGPFDHLAHTDEDEDNRENRDVAPIPKRVQGLEGVKIVKAVTNCTISAAISEVGDLYTWGDHHCAGYDTKNLNIQYPQRIAPLAGKVLDVAVGPSFVIALDTRGQLWSWGCMFQKNNDPVTAYPLGHAGKRSFQPMKIPRLPRITQVTCIGTTVFAIDADGQLWYWGDSANGECFQVGVSYGTPLVCDYFRDLKVEKIAHGYGRSCCVYTSPV